MSGVTFQMQEALQDDGKVWCCAGCAAKKHGVSGKVVLRLGKCDKCFSDRWHYLPKDEQAKREAERAAWFKRKVDAARKQNAEAKQARAQREDTASNEQKA